jgi:hypothetical protein
VPHRSHGRGTFELDRLFDGIGRVRRASGTRDPDTFRAINAMLTVLYDRGRHDVLEAIRDGKVKAVHALDRFRRERLEDLPLGDALAPLEVAWEAYVRTIPGERHARAFRSTKRALRIGPEHTVHELPRLLEAYSKRCPPRMGELAKAHAQAFLRDTLHAGHPLYRAVQAIRVAPRNRTRARIGTALPWPHLVALLRQLPAEARGMARTLAVTGMGRTEYFRDGFTVLEDRIVIHGRKRRGRAREVPRWAPVTEPMMHERKFAALLGDVPLYALRKTFAHLMEEAGIPRTRRRAYLGHGGARDVTDLYERVEVTAFLEEDAERLRRHAQKARHLLDRVAQRPVAKARGGELPTAAQLAELRVGDLEQAAHLRRRKGDHAAASRVAPRSSRISTTERAPAAVSRSAHSSPVISTTK